MLGEDELAPEIAQMRELMERDWRRLDIDQDLGLGMMLWLAHFFPGEPWAEAQRTRALRTLDTMWVDPPGYFSRGPWLRDTRFAFTNYGVSLGLQDSHRCRTCGSPNHLERQPSPGACSETRERPGHDAAGLSPYQLNGSGEDEVGGVDVRHVNAGQGDRVAAV